MYETLNFLKNEKYVDKGVAVCYNMSAHGVLKLLGGICE